MTDPMHDPAAVGPEGLDLDALRAEWEDAGEYGQREWALHYADPLLAALAAARAEVERLNADVWEAMRMIRETEDQRDEARAALARVEALADEIERAGVTCACGHYVGGEHNSNGCYAVITYNPLVRCSCVLTDDQDEDAIVAARLRAALSAAPSETGEGLPVTIRDPRMAVLLRSIAKMPTSPTPTDPKEA